MFFDKENDQNWLNEMGLTRPMFDVNGELISDKTPYLAGKGIERRAK